MKTYVGSLQKRGRRYYLVVHRQGKQRWFALKTDKLTVARMRAAKIAPADPDDETAWLEQLVRAGEAARCQLVTNSARRELTWENIALACQRNGEIVCSFVSHACHERWLRVLAENVKRLAKGAEPGALTREMAADAIGEIAQNYISAPRMLSFYRKAWHALGLNRAVWPKRLPTGARVLEDAGEHYRRLTLDEVRKVHAHLAAVAPSLADMVLIGYSTGLRLSDVAELELSEIDGAFLRVCPNKTRRHKPVPIKIPLTSEARIAIARLVAAARAGRRQFVFPLKDRHRPSRRIAAVFRRCGVLRIGKGRASFHSLRATFISLMDDAGIPPHVTDAITGHGGGGMHARYTQPSDAALMSAVVRAIPAL